MSLDKSLTEVGLRDLRDAGNTGQGRIEGRRKEKDERGTKRSEKRRLKRRKGRKRM